MVVAVSGGPDSTALLLTLVEAGRDVVAAHYDHALRTDSAAEAKAVANLCNRLGVACFTERRTKPLDRGSLQAAARRARYDFLERIREAAGADLIATAHTLDDHVETVLINLLRGSGIPGLAGLPERRDRIVRPFRRVRRSEVIALLATKRIDYLFDPSNLDRRFLRVRVRHELLPALERADPRVRERIIHLAELAAAATQLQDANLPTAARQDLQSAPAHARARALALLYRTATKGGPPPTRRQLLALNALVSAWREGARLDLPAGVQALLTSDRVLLAPARAGEPSRRMCHELIERPCPGCAIDAAVHLKPGELKLGRRAPGLRLRPPGSTGSRKLQDVLVDAKLPAAHRDDVPLVFRDGALAWVPGIAVDVEHATDRSKPGRHVEVRSVEEPEALKN